MVCILTKACQSTSFPGTEPRFEGRKPPSRSGASRTPQVPLVHFHLVLEASALEPHHGGTQLLQEQPGFPKAPEPQGPLQPRCARSPVSTHVMSATRTGFGEEASKRRWTRSGATWASRSALVVQRGSDTCAPCARNAACTRDAQYVPREAAWIRAIR